MVDVENKYKNMEFTLDRTKSNCCIDLRTEEIKGKPLKIPSEQRKQKKESQIIEI